MKFSVILPVYNRESCVAKSILSVSGQSFDDWELVIVNDGSIDGSLRICKEIARNESRITVIDQENKGVSAARNAGICASNGDYILFLDSDDVMAEGLMASLADTIKKFNEPDIIAGGFGAASGETWIPDETICGKLHDKTYIDEYILPEHINVHPQTKYFLQPFVWNKCFKRSLIFNSGISFDERRRTWEDNGFLVSCLSEANEILISDNVFIIMGDSGNNDHLSASCTPNMLFGYIKSYEEYTQQFGNRYEFNNKYTNTRYYTFTCNILSQLNTQMGQNGDCEFDRILDRIFNNSDVELWFKNAKTNGLNNALIRFAFSIKNKALLKKLLKKREKLSIRIRIFLSRIKRKLLKFIKI